MSKFSKGDRIVVTESELACGEYRNGDVGTVLSVTEDGDVYVDFDHRDDDVDMARCLLYEREAEHPSDVVVRPTWEGMVTALLLLHSDGSAEGKEFARSEFVRMAKAADSKS